MKLLLIIFAHILMVNYKISCEETSTKVSKIFRGTKKATIRDLLQFDDGKYHPERDLKYRPNFDELKFDDGQYRPDNSGYYRHRGVKYIHVDGPKGPDAVQYVHIDTPYKDSSKYNHGREKYVNTNEKYSIVEPNIRGNLRRNEYFKRNEEIAQKTNVNSNRGRRINNDNVRRKVIRKNNRNNKEESENRNNKYDKANIDDLQINNSRHSQFSRPNFINHDISKQVSDEESERQRFTTFLTSTPTSTESVLNKKELFTDVTQRNNENSFGDDKEFKYVDNQRQNVQINQEYPQEKLTESSTAFAEDADNFNGSNKQKNTLQYSNSHNNPDKLHIKQTEQNLRSFTESNKYDDVKTNSHNNYSGNNSGHYYPDNSGQYKHLDNKYEHVDAKYKHTDNNYKHVDNKYEHDDSQYKHTDNNYKHVDNKYEHVGTKYKHTDNNYKHVDNKYEHVDNKYQHIENRYKNVEGPSDLNGGKYKQEDGQNRNNEQYVPERYVHRQQSSVNKDNDRKFNGNQRQNHNRNSVVTKTRDVDDSLGSGSKQVNQPKTTNKSLRFNDEKVNDQQRVDTNYDDTIANENVDQPSGKEFDFLNQLLPPQKSHTNIINPSASQHAAKPTEGQNIGYDDSVPADSINVKKFYSNDDKKSFNNNNNKEEVSKDKINFGKNNQQNVVYIGYGSTRSPVNRIDPTPKTSGRAGIEIIKSANINNKNEPTITESTTSYDKLQRENASNPHANKRVSENHERNKSISKESNTKLHKYEETQSNDHLKEVSTKRLNQTIGIDYLKRFGNVDQKQETGHTLRFKSSVGEGVSFGIGKKNIISQTGGEKSGSVLYRCKKESKDGYKFNFDTNAGIKQDEEGALQNKGTDKEAMCVTGYYTYLGPDNKEYMVYYTADEYGFRPEGDHIHPEIVNLLKDLQIG